MGQMGSAGGGRMRERKCERPRCLMKEKDKVAHSGLACIPSLFTLNSSGRGL